ncbi:MAG: translation initiation factor [Flavipsychrobacter sp.]|nr:translation initiation factor [Flavipsychrobacter sp.]
MQEAKAEEDDKPEHIEMKAPRLEGPKIIGKIDLPVADSSKGDSKEKRNRKRIPVQKKPESFRPDQQGQAGGGQGGGYQGQRPNQGGGGGGYQGQRPNQGGGGGYQGQRPNQGSGGGGYQGQRPGQGGGYQGQRGPGQRGPGQGGPGGDRRGGQRFGQPAPTQQQQEIDAKAIQDKIRQTQAKLAGSTRSKSLKAKYRRNKRDEMAEKRAAAEQSSQGNTIQVTEFISVAELASLLNVSFADVISKCMSLGIMVSINQRLDAEVIELVSSEFGYDVEFINLEQEADIDEEEDDDPEDMIPRAPIVTIMGHVDHGKTSLLDYIRSANVVAGEAGGITQHIGAYQVETATGKRITFLDTPGHEAFTAMRARGAKVADVAVIVVAADDAIMPQTKEAISHAQAANLPMIFAINKIDKEGANPEKIKEQLAGMNILVEDWGGKFQSQEISAKKGLNIDLLLEKIGLEAELLEVKANPERLATGSVIEASLDKGRGYQATILVQNGTLEQGDMIVCGQYYGKIKAMFNERGQRVEKAGPSAPVQVLGLNGAPQAGEKFKVFEEEDEAKEVANHRAQIMREQGIRTRKHITLDEIGRRLALGNFKELGIIIKGDFDGSVEALSDSLQKLSTEEVAVNVVHKGVGQITESDVLLATASDAIIIGFQVRPSMQAARLAEQENIEIRTYSIIYDAIEEIKSAMEGLLEPKIEKKTVCNIEVRDVFKITGVGTIAGCYVLDGKINRNTKVNLVRDGIVVYTGELASLKRFKDDVKEVAAGYECGLSIKNYNDIRVNDIIEGFEEVEVKRTL